MEKEKKCDLLKWSAEVLVLLLLLSVAAIGAAPERHVLARRLSPVARALRVDHFDLADWVRGAAGMTLMTLTGPTLPFALTMETTLGILLVGYAMWFTFWAVGCAFILTGRRVPRRLFYGIVVATGLLLLLQLCSRAT